MANLAFPPTAAVDLGGNHPQYHRLVYDLPNQVHNSDQRLPPSENTATRSANHTGGRGRGASTTEDDANEDDDEDSSVNQDADQEDEDDDADVLAPSHGLGKGKGKRPVIRIEPAGDDASPQDEQDDEETASRETGLTYSTLMVDPPLTPRNKKRTFSNVSNNSVLFGEHGMEEREFPRSKVPRKLSHNGGRPLLAYTKDANDQNRSGFENAIESDDEEKQIDVDDEDYSGVALISDDDDSDVENVEQQEEHFIVSDEHQRANALFNEFFDARRLSLDSHASDNIFDVTAPLDENFLAAMVPDAGFGQFFEPPALPPSPDAIAKRKYSDSSTKRVRFDDEVQISSDSSSSSDEGLDNSLFPDLFLEQDKLPPSLYQLIENDNDDSDNEDFASPGSDRSYWDVGQEESRSFKPYHTAQFDESSDAGSSGYETDMGDTTDEYESDFGSPAPPQTQTPLQKSVLRRPSSAPGSKAASPNPFQRSSRPAPTGRTIIPPLRGIFIHEESSKAIAVTNRATKTLTFYRPRASASPWASLPTTYSSSASTANNSPRPSMQQFNISDNDMTGEVFNNPYTTDIMLTGIFGSAPANNFLFGGDSVGPPEAFYPFLSVGEDGNIDDEIDDDFDDDEDFEDDINIADFMDFGSDADATDAEQEEEIDIPATPATSMAALNGSTPAQPTPMAETPINNRKRNTSDVMLEHFDRGVVTAFRNNQNRHRDIACLPHDPDLRASVSRPIRSGRSAEALISPLRKRGAVPKKRNGPSPFAGVTKATSRLQNSVMGNHRGPPRMGTFS